MTEVARYDPDAVVPAQAPKMTPPSGFMTPMEMIQTALSNGSGIEVIDKLMSLQERWEANQGRKAFDMAISAAKGEIPPIIKDRTVDFTSSKGRTHYRHESLAGIAKVVDPILGKYGLSYRFRTQQDGRAVTVTCVVSHRDGYSEETTLSAGADESGNKNTIQQVGSTITYLQRYTLRAALGLSATDDDDGKQADAAASPNITEAQYIELQGLIDAAGVKEQVILDAANVAALHFLPQSKHPSIVKKLNATIKANEASE